MQLRITSVPGDGIGPEVTLQAVRVLEEVTEGFGHDLELDEKEIGGAALAKFGTPLPESTIQSNAERRRSIRIRPTTASRSASSPIENCTKPAPCSAISPK